MLNEEQIKKLEEWCKANPKAAKEPFINPTTGVELTLEGALGMAQASLAGEAQLDETLQSSINDIAEWLEGGVSDG
jgi:hypothetical protein